MLAAEASPLSLVPPSSAAGWHVGHLLGCRHQPHLDRTCLGGVLRGKFRSGVIKSSTPEAEPLQTESNPLCPESWGSSSSLRVPPPCGRSSRTRTPQQVSSDGVAARRECLRGKGQGPHSLTSTQLWGVPPVDVYQKGLKIGGGESHREAARLSAPQRSALRHRETTASRRDSRGSSRSIDQGAVSRDSSETFPMRTRSTNVRNQLSFTKEDHLYNSSNSKDCTHSKYLSFTSTMQSK